MSGRIGAVTALFAIVVLTDSAFAHALEGRFVVLADKKVRVEAWFETDDPASGAKVEVFKVDKQLLVSGKTDKDGYFDFSFVEPEPLEVKIDAGRGHGKILTITADELNKPSADPGPRRSAPSEGGGTEASSRPAAFPLREVFVGIAFLLALAAFVISIRNARAIKQLRDNR
jgi:hypothetical protein